MAAANGWTRTRTIVTTIAAVLGIVSMLQVPLWWFLNEIIEARINARVPHRIWTTDMMEAMRLQYALDNPGTKVRSAHEIYREHSKDGRR